MVTNSDPQPDATATAVVLFGREIGVSFAQPEKDEALALAALTLCSLKCATLDEEEMAELPRMKQQVLNRCRGRAIGCCRDGITKPSLPSSSSSSTICSLKYAPFDEEEMVELPRTKQQQVLNRCIGRSIGGGGGCCRGGITKPSLPSSSSSSTICSKSRRRLRFSGDEEEEEVLKVPKVQKLPKLQPSQAMVDRVKSCIILPTHMPEIPGLAGELIGRRSRPFVKQLTVTDLKDDQSKLSLSKEDVEECISPMLNRREDPISGVKVTIYDIYGGSFEMAYKKWAGGKTHVLTSGWKDFYKRHGLLEHQDYLTVWIFRRADTGKLCFLLTWRRLDFCGIPIKRKLLKGP